MSLNASFGHAPAQSLPVYPATTMIAIDGANLGDTLSVADDLIAGDVYQLATGAERVRLALANRPGQVHHTIAHNTEIGRIGADVHMDCCVTFMSPDGTLLDLLIFVEIARDACTIAAVHLFPLGPVAPRTGYALIAVDRHVARSRFAETACVSFTRGTHITMASGRQVAIEDLVEGDTVLTRDRGPQQIRWIGRQTVRAQGAFAPIRIAKGALHNENDLIVSPNHRLFVYQRRDSARAGRAEVLIKAKYLLNGDTVTRTDGGFVDYFQLLFDRHEIIYAEGIAAETLLVDPRTQPALPAQLRDRDIGLRHFSDTRAVELTEGALDCATAADLLRRASAC